jgi:hypothetical protein
MAVFLQKIMLRDYMVVSPSLDGVLRHDSVTYEGVKRPPEVMRILDGPSTRGQGSHGSGHRKPPTVEQLKVLEEYFNDIYGVFMKKLSHFVVAATAKPDDIVKLHALFQELIKIKELMGRGE